MENESMRSHYQGIKDAQRYERSFSMLAPVELGKHDLWSDYQGSFILSHSQTDVGDAAVPAYEALSGLFGLVPHWATGFEPDWRSDKAVATA